MIKTGQKVENFKRINQEGKEIQLSDYKGKKVIIFFYPKASTPGCTAQAATCATTTPF